MRPAAVAVVSLVAAAVGGIAALLVAIGLGLVSEGSTETSVVTAATEASARDAIAVKSAAKPLTGNGFNPARLYAERSGGVVTVYALFDEHQATGDASQGSGFVVSKDGYVLTNSHVITDAGGGTGSQPDAASEVYVGFKDGERVPAEIVGWDVFDDVGLLKVDADAHPLRPLPLGDSAAVKVGQPVVAIGSPFGQTSTITAGIVGATERSIGSLTSSYSLVDAIQTDAPINRGNSGGPLLDARGRVIGINAQIRSESGSAEGVGFAVPINSAIRSMDQLIDTGEVRYAWVGISTQTVTPGLARRFDFGAERGATVSSVTDDSPAERAGLRPGRGEVEFGGITICPGGDLIVAIDDEPVETAEDVVRAVTERLPGETARFTVLRGDERLVVTVRLGERPATPPDPDRCDV
jgi:2-alkenal reductase